MNKIFQAESVKCLFYLKNVERQHFKPSIIIKLESGPPSKASDFNVPVCSLLGATE